MCCRRFATTKQQHSPLSQALQATVRNSPIKAEFGAEAPLQNPLFSDRRFSYRGKGIVATAGGR
jgi:hypothetical protein